MASQPTSIFIGSGASGVNPQQLELGRANRHGLIAGATGTGKTVTLQGIVEGLCDAGVPTFVADVKGDLAGLAMPGAATAKPHAAFVKRAEEIGYSDWRYEPCPVQFWDLFGEQGHPIRTTISEMGPLLLARLMNLNEVQEGVLSIAFHVADKEGLLILDLDDPLEGDSLARAGRSGDQAVAVGALELERLRLGPARTRANEQIRVSHVPPLRSRWRKPNGSEGEATEYSRGARSSSAQRAALVVATLSAARYQSR